jgi:hypothetical protein
VKQLHILQLLLLVLIGVHRRVSLLLIEREPEVSVVRVYLQRKDANHGDTLQHWVYFVVNQERGLSLLS